MRTLAVTKSLAMVLCAVTAMACSSEPDSPSYWAGNGQPSGGSGGTSVVPGSGGAAGGSGAAGAAGTGGAATGGSGGSAGSGGAAATGGSGGGNDAGSDVVEQPWVEVSSPAAGETVTNPVTIAFSAGGGVLQVTFEVDGWPLHDTPLDANAGTFTYSFSGVGYERHMVMTGLDGAGSAIATFEVAFTPVATTSALVFPIDLGHAGTLSKFDSSTSSASFGAARSGGRLHAGCDLYWTNDGGYDYTSGYYALNNNTPIYAVADGTITDYYAFYQGTNALVVDHGDFVVRYGEVDDGGLPNGLGIGSQVTAGQQIAVMGDLDMSSGTWSMLHFEVYSGQLSGALTNTSNTSYLHVPNGNYQRRGDLMDCGPFLRDIMP